MAKKRITEQQAREIVKAVEAGAKPADLAKQHGFSLGTYYNWRAKFGSKKPAKKTAAKKAAPKKAAPAKPAAKRGRKPAAKKAAPKKRATVKRGRKPAARKAAPKGAAAIKAQILGLQGQIKAIEAKIADLKVTYANAVFG